MRIIGTGGEIQGKDVIVALGTFDGVHKGHQALFHRAGAIKEETGMPVLALTFHPHPRIVLGDPQGYDRLLTPQEEKVALLDALGVDYFWSVPFTRDLAAMEPESFANQYLAELLSVRHVVCGFNFTFGRKGAGNPSYLWTRQRDLGFLLHVVRPLNVGGSPVSSTRVRRALARGHTGDAAYLLGRPYCLQGYAGQLDGGTLKVDVSGCKLLPGPGVYTSVLRVSLSEEMYPGVTTLGSGVEIEVRNHSSQRNLSGRNVQVFLTTEGEGEDLSSFTLMRAYDRMLSQELPQDSGLRSSGACLG